MPSTSIPSPERVPRRTAVLAEQFDTAGVWGTGLWGLQGKAMMLPWLALSLVIAAYFVAWQTVVPRWVFSDYSGPGTPSFLPGIGTFVIYAGLWIGLIVWDHYPANYLQSLPVKRRTHDLMRVAALWGHFLVAAAMLVVGGGVYALLLGAPERYLTELPIYLPVVLVAGTVLYLLAAALSLATRWSGSLVSVVVIMLAATFALDSLPHLFPGPAGGVADQALMVFGMLPQERLAALDPSSTGFPYGAWALPAIGWLTVGATSVYLAAGRYHEAA